MRLARTWVLVAVGVAALTVGILVAALALVARGQPTHFWNTMTWEQPGPAPPGTRYEVRVLDRTYVTRTRTLRLCLPAGVTLPTQVRACVPGSCSDWTPANGPAALPTRTAGDRCQPD